MDAAGPRFPSASARMEQRRNRAALSLVLALVTLTAWGFAACATTPEMPEVPPWTEVSDGALPLAPRERSLWDESSARYRVFVRQKRILSDPELDTYVSGVVARLFEAESLPEGVPRPVAYVLRHRTPGALSDPMGRLYVTVGMLREMESEDELAALLGHELAHFIGRDAYRLRLYSRQTTWANAWMHQSRRLERAADRKGVALAAEAGYDPVALADTVSGLGGWTNPLSAVFDSRRSHPLSGERARDVEREASSSFAEAPPSRLVAEYEQGTAAVWLADAELALAAGEIQEASSSLEHYLDLRPPNARVHLVRGSILRALDDGDRHEEAYLAEFERAYALSPEDPDILLVFGLALRERGQHDRAQELIRAYLDGEPGASKVYRGELEAYLAEPWAIDRQ